MNKCINVYRILSMAQNHIWKVTILGFYTIYQMFWKHSVFWYTYIKISMQYIDMLNKAGDSIAKNASYIRYLCPLWYTGTFQHTPPQWCIKQCQWHVWNNLAHTPWLLLLWSNITIHYLYVYSACVRLDEILEASSQIITMKINCKNYSMFMIIAVCQSPKDIYNKTRMKTAWKHFTLGRTDCR